MSQWKKWQFQISDRELDCNQLDADINKLIIHDQSGSILYIHTYIFHTHPWSLINGYRISPALTAINLMLNLSSWRRWWLSARNAVSPWGPAKWPDSPTKDFASWDVSWFPKIWAWLLYQLFNLEKGKHSKLIPQNLWGSSTPNTKKNRAALKMAAPRAIRNQAEAPG